MTAFRMSHLLARLELPGSDLLQRSYGQRAYSILEQELLQTPSDRALRMNFNDISLMDTSFADGAVVELALALVAGKYGDRFLILEQPNQDTIDNIEGAIARRKAKIAIIVNLDNTMGIIGQIEPNLQEAWLFILRTGIGTARDLADHLNLEINTASTRLHKLYRARLLARREEVTSLGRQHLYEIPR